MKKYEKPFHGNYFKPGQGGTSKQSNNSARIFLISIGGIIAVILIAYFFNKQ